MTLMMLCADAIPDSEMKLWKLPSKFLYFFCIFEGFLAFFPEASIHGWEPFLKIRENDDGGHHKFMKFTPRSLEPAERPSLYG